MTFTDNDIKKIAHLARLAIDDHDIPTHVNNLRNILNLLEQMEAVNTDGVQPMAHPLDVHQRFRHDIVSEPNQRELFQSIAPKVDAEAGIYLVPAVIE